MKKRIIIGSILKPVNDVRMYEKIGISLSREAGYDIHIAGFKSTIPSHPTNVTLHPLFDFKRLDLKRFSAPWKFYKLLVKVKPDLTIVTTHELLTVAILNKILFGGKIIYDVQENYYRNIAYTNAFPPIVRNVLATWVRIKEWITRPWIDHYLLAEKNYEKEFSFSKGRSTIIENKTLVPTSDLSIPSRATGKIRLLYTGTISENYGIFEAIDLAINLHRIDKDITLTIIGYCSKNQTFKEVKEKISPFPFITLKGGDSIVPHDQIVREIKNADFGLIAYRPDKSTINCIPTRIYEYLAYRLPMIVRTNRLWMETIEPYQAGIEIDYLNFSAETVLTQMKEFRFFNTYPGDEVLWSEEETKLQKAIKSIL